MMVPVGEAQIGINFDFIARALTEKGIEDGSISVLQHFKVQEATFDESEKMIYLTCEIFEEVLN